MQRASVIPHIVLDDWVVDVFYDIFSVFDSCYFQMAEYIKISVEWECVEHLENILVLLVLINFYLSTSGFPADVLNRMVLNCIFVSIKFVEYEIFEQMQY